MTKKPNIPQVAKILNLPKVKALVESRGHKTVVSVIRIILKKARDKGVAVTLETIVPRIDQAFQNLTRPGLQKVVNATGTLVHTNLGRSVLGQNVWKALEVACTGYSDLEFDLKNGARGKRGTHLEDKIVHLAGGDSALVVNNNAAAVMLCINTFALQKEVIVSRGELVEIGGSFRLPDIIERSGGVLKEVGTTNKTRLSDYKKAIGPKTGLILKMHASNYTIKGFTQEVPIKELAALGKKVKKPVVHDVGSGLFVDPKTWNLQNEPHARQSLKEGASVVTMSGDKLLGGPQAGILIGQQKAIGALRKNPMMRALRMDKLGFAALDSVLSAYLDAADNIETPLLALAGVSSASLKTKAARLAKKISRTNPRLKVRVEKSKGSFGGGAQPTEFIESFSTIITHSQKSPKELHRVVRTSEHPVVGDFLKGAFALNVLTLLKGEEKDILSICKHL